MAVAFGAAGTLGAAASGTSIAPALPSFSVGNLFLGVVASKNNATHTWPAGWTKVTQVNSGASWTVSWAWRIAQTGDTAPSVTWSGSVANTGQIWTYTGQDQFGPIGIVGAASTGTTSPHSSASITTTRANSLAIYLDCCSANTALTLPSGYSSNVSNGSATSVTHTDSGSKTVATQGTATGAISTAGGAAAWVEWQIEIFAPMPPDPDQQIVDLPDPHLKLGNQDRLDRFWTFKLTGAPWISAQARGTSKFTDLPPAYAVPYRPDFTWTQTRALLLPTPPDNTKIFRGHLRSLPDQPPPPNAFQSWTQSLAAPYAAQIPIGSMPGEPVLDLAPGQRPPEQIQLHSWTASYNLNLIGKDRLPAGAMPGEPVFDLAPGQRPPEQIQLHSWTASYNLNLIGKDRLPVGVLPGEPVYDLTASQRPPPPQQWQQHYNLNLYGAKVFPTGVMPGEEVYDRPQLPPEQIQLHSWTASYNLNLIGKDQLPTGVMPGETVYDLVAAQRQPVPQQWIHPYNLNLYAPPTPADNTKIFRGIWRSLPDQPPAPLLQQSAFRAFPLTAVTVQAPFNQYDWPVPRAAQPSAQTWTWSYNLNLVGQDKLPVGENVTDRPQLVVPPHALTWIESVQYGLIAKPFAQYDWPNPTPPWRPDPTWTRSYTLSLIGQDKLPVGEQVYDLAPSQRVPEQIQLHSWVAFYNLNLVGQDKLPVGEQVYDLAPRDFSRLFQTWIQNTNLALLITPPVFPYNQFDWPNPRAPQQPAQSFTASYNANLIGQDKLPNGEQITDLPPRDFSRLLQTWIQNVNLALYVTPPVFPAGNQYDWPNPRAPLQPAQSFTASYNANLIGKDQLPVGEIVTERPQLLVPSAQTWIDNVKLLLNAKPFAQYDWPNPRAPQQPAQSWTASYDLNLIGQDQLPTGQRTTELPPRDHVRQLQTWINAVNLCLATAAVPLPFNQADWPNPRAPQQAAQSWTASYNLNLIGQDRLPTGEQIFDLAPRDHLRMRDLYNWLQIVNLALIVPPPVFPPGIHPGNLLYDRTAEAIPQPAGSYFTGERYPIIPPGPPVPPSANEATVSGPYVNCNYGVSGLLALGGFSNPVNPYFPVQLLTNTGAGGYVGPGDVLGPSFFLGYWSLRAFSFATMGQRVVQLRRVSDGIVADFNTLSPSGQLDIASITSWALGSSLKIVKFYDQSGNGNDIVPASPAFEQLFTPNIINGMGVFDNTAGNGTTYKFPITTTVANTWSHNFFAVYQPTSSVSVWQSLVAIGFNEIAMIANDGGGGFNPAVKNESGATTFLFGSTTPTGTWHAVASEINQNVGSNSFIITDSPANLNTAVMSGVATTSEQAICVWGDDGNGPNTNPLIGYGVEAAWFANPPPASPWTEAQANALIANARAFWGF